MMFMCVSSAQAEPFYQIWRDILVVAKGQAPDLDDELRGVRERRAGPPELLKVPQAFRRRPRVRGMPCVRVGGFRVQEYQSSGL